MHDTLPASEVIVRDKEREEEEDEAVEMTLFSTTTASQHLSFIPPELLQILLFSHQGAAIYVLVRRVKILLHSMARAY